MTNTQTAAHNQTESCRYIMYYPAHDPRASDPHYHLFNVARARIIKAGIGCWICGCKDHIELHHSEVEYALLNGEDYAKVALDFPQYKLTNDDEFAAWVESEGNLRALCMDHHRSPYLGIHHVAYPNWKAQRWAKAGVLFLQPATPGIITPTIGGEDQ